MAGLGAAPPPGPEQQQPGAPAPEAMDGEPASPEEQAVYDKIVAVGMQLMYDEETSADFIEGLKDGDPIDEVADFVAQAAVKVMEVAAAEGAPIPLDIMLPAVQELVEQACEMAESAGMELTPQQMEQAFYHALDRGRAQAQGMGLLDDAAIQESAAGLQEAEADGRMAQILAALEAQLQSGGAPQPPTGGGLGVGAPANANQPPMQGVA